VNIGHLPSAGETQSRYDRPVDVSFVIDALARAAAAARGTPHNDEEALPIPAEFVGEPDVDHIGVIGHSFGAFAAQAVGGVELGPTLGIRNFRDPRVDAIVPIAPPSRDRHGHFDKGAENNSWRHVAIPSYLLVGELDLPEWRRLAFDRYPPTGDKFLTIGAGQTHMSIAGYQAPVEVRRLLDLNTALFFHTYLRGGDARDRIDSLAWIDGWTLERKVE
jgi:hypothetical protein